jgi:hypothetical protein
MSIPAALAIIAAASKIYSGVQEQKMYNFQAEQSRLKGQREELRGRTQALNFNNQALDVLRNQRKFYAAAAARGAAGGVDPFSGSISDVMFQQGVLSGRDFDVSRENAVAALNAGLEANLALQTQAGIYKEAGRNALIGSILEAGFSAYQGYEFGTKLQTPGSPNAPIERRTPTPVNSMNEPAFPSSAGFYR